MKKGKDSFYSKVIKRMIDVFVSLTALIILSPLFVVLIVLGAIKMQGNPFFVQKRPGKIGKNGKEKIFKLIKFRTMSNKKDRDGNLLPDEERLTKYGLICRKLSFDEIPELLNIFIGDMSLIGPRPLLIEYIPYYTEVERHRHDLRPGLTGWAQVNGRNNVPWDKRFEYDVEYVNNVSLKFDVKIMIMTVKSVIAHDDIASDTRQIEGNFAQIRRERQELAVKK